jgi:hypothetical protein
MASRGVPPQRAFVWTLIAFIACFGNTVIRAQSFAYPLFVLVFWAILSDSRRSSPRFLLVIPLLVLWSNLHGTILLGIVLVAGYAVAKLVASARARSGRDALVYAAAAVAAVGTAFANPYGVSIVDYYRSLIGNPVVGRYILEWAPPSLGFPASYAFFGLLFAVIAIVGYGIGRGCRPAPTLLAVVAALGLLATQGVRYQAWFALSGSVLAAETLGADLAYVGTRFIATTEANAPAEYKQMLIESAAEDIVYTSYFSGVHGNYLKPSIKRAGLDPDALPEADKSRMAFGAARENRPKSWKEIWGAGQGTGQIKDVLPTAEVVARLKDEYEEARQRVRV